MGGSVLQIKGTLNTEVTIGDMDLNEGFVIAQIEDRIVGIPFFTKYRCKIICNPPTLVVKGMPFRCTDSSGRSIVYELTPGIQGLVNTNPVGKVLIPGYLGSHQTGYPWQLFTSTLRKVIMKSWQSLRTMQQ